MNIVCVGDQHIARRHLPTSLDALGNVVKYCFAHSDLDLIVLMGDILDRHDDMKQSLLRIAIDFVEALINHPSAIIVVLIGNHDRINNRDIFSNIHPFMGMKDVPGKLYFAYRPISLTIKQKKLLFVPYVPPNMFMSSLQKEGIDASSYDLIFAHQEFKDAIGPFGTAEEEWHGPLLISGHIHEYGYKKPNLLYTGSLYQISHGEDANKGILHGRFDQTFEHSLIPMTAMMKVTKKLNISQLSEINHSDHFIVEGTSDEVTLARSHLKGMSNVRYIINGVNRQKRKITFDEIFTEELQKKGLLEVAKTILV